MSAAIKLSKSGSALYFGRSGRRIDSGSVNLVFRGLTTDDPLNGERLAGRWGRRDFAVGSVLHRYTLSRLRPRPGCTRYSIWLRPLEARMELAGIVAAMVATLFLLNRKILPHVAGI